MLVSVIPIVRTKAKPSPAAREANMYFLHGEEEVEVASLDMLPSRMI